MSDIVERLREAAASLSEIYPDYAEAADEISRLRAENERFRENEILLSKDGKKWRNAIDIITEMNAENEKLRAANERLREALSYYAEEDYNGYNGNGACARAALEGVKEKYGAENE